MPRRDECACGAPLEKAAQIMAGICSLQCPAREPEGEDEMLAELRARPPRRLMTREEAELLRRSTWCLGAVRHCVDSYLAVLDEKDAIPNPETERAA